MARGGFEGSYTVITCPRCGRQVTLPTWKVYSLFKGREPSASKLTCSRCGTKGATVRGRG